MAFIKKYGYVFFILFLVAMFTKPVLCFIILGGLFFCIGLFADRLSQSLKKNGLTSTGFIVRYETDNDGYKTLVVEFKAISGEVIRSKPYMYASTDLSKLKSYSDKIDQQVEVLYLPGDPQKFILAGEQSFNGVVFTIFLLIGAVFIIIGAASLLGFIKNF